MSFAFCLCWVDHPLLSIFFFLRREIHGCCCKVKTQKKKKIKSERDRTGHPPESKHSSQNILQIQLYKDKELSLVSAHLLSFYTFLVLLSSLGCTHTVGPGSACYLFVLVYLFVFCLLTMVRVEFGPSVPCLLLPRSRFARSQHTDIRWQTDLTDWLPRGLVALPNCPKPTKKRAIERKTTERRETLSRFTFRPGNGLPPPTQLFHPPKNKKKYKKKVRKQQA